MNSPVRHKGVLQPKVRVSASPGGNKGDDAIAVALNAAVLAMRGDEPVVAIVPAAASERPGDGALPCGPFHPSEHGTLEGGMRACVRGAFGIEVGFLQQLYALSCHNGQHATPQTTVRPHLVSVSYLGLVGPEQLKADGRGAWHSWYTYFPWEDWRQGKPACLGNEIESCLRAWAEQPEPPCATSRALGRGQRLCISFGFDGAAWDEEKVLERYEVLSEAGLIGEARAHTGAVAGSLAWRLPNLLHALAGDQGRVLASAIAELRRSIKCRPAVFEMMHEEFTLYELQKTVEAILGPHLHKQNFRRLVEGCGLVEPTSDFRLRTGGRPARLYRFRRRVLLERAAPGVRVKPGRV